MYIIHIHIHIHTCIHTHTYMHQSTDLQQLRRARAIARQRDTERHDIVAETQEKKSGKKKTPLEDNRDDTYTQGSKHTQRQQSKEQNTQRSRHGANDLRSMLDRKMETGKKKRVKQRGGFTFEIESDDGVMDSSSESLVTQGPPPSGSYTVEICVCPNF